MMPDTLSTTPSPSSHAALRVLIVDDHALLVEGLSNLLSTRGIDVVGTAANGLEGFEQALRLEPDLVLMDISMPNCNGLTATRMIKAKRPNMKIVILTTSGEDEDLFEAIKSGACGYLLKSTRGTAFIEALRGLEDGIPPFSPGLAARLLREFARLAEPGQTSARDGKGSTESNPPADVELPAQSARPNSLEPHPLLTDRQTEVLRLVASGLTYKEVGEKLSLSDHTVRYHMGEIMQLLHVENRSQLIAYAGKLKLD